MTEAQKQPQPAEAGVPAKKAKKPKRAIVWDETNLQQNAEYMRTHPVTKPIDEPKTPYNWEDDPTIEEALAKEEAHGAESSWDPKYATVAKHAKLHADLSCVRESTAPAPATDQPQRPTIATSQLTEEELNNAEQRRKQAEFRAMRRAVYADEGKKFLKQKTQGDTDEANNDAEAPPLS